MTRQSVSVRRLILPHRLAALMRATSCPRVSVAVLGLEGRLAGPFTLRPLRYFGTLLLLGVIRGRYMHF